VRKLKLITNNPKKIVGLEGYDLEIVERVPMKVEQAEESKKYINTKKEKLDHLF